MSSPRPPHSSPTCGESRPASRALSISSRLSESSSPCPPSRGSPSQGMTTSRTNDSVRILSASSSGVRLKSITDTNLAPPTGRPAGRPARTSDHERNTSRLVYTSDMRIARMRATISHPPLGPVDESRHPFAHQADSGRGRGLYPRHQGRGAVRVEGARDRAGGERLGHRHPFACVERERARGEEALRRARTGPSDRDEAGVDRDALQYRDPPRGGDCAPGTVARGGVDPAAMPQRGPGRDGRRHRRQPRHRDGRRAQRVRRPVRHGVHGQDL